MSESARKPQSSHNSGETESASGGHGHGHDDRALRPRWLFRAEGWLAILAIAMFLGGLGASDLWGKREQRAAAEALDTLDQSHWVVAEIQSRPRLEKPPLPRWIIAGLMAATGSINELIVRLPNALSALGMVALTYALGRGLGGRRLGLASGFILASMAFFVIEMRQAGNDGMLSLFTTLAVYAAWRRLHARPPAADAPAPALGAPRWGLLMWIALGLGFLCKGPIILLLIALTLVPYLAVAGRLKSDWRALAHPWGIAAFAALALSWPAMVLLNDPEAWRIWYLEMAMKAGSAGVGNESKSREVLLTQWPVMTSQWIVPATAALFLPFLKRGRSLNLGPGLWFPWMWASANLIMFCFWRVAKSNYFLPCLPAVALLAGVEWLKVAEESRQVRQWLSRLSLFGHWLVFGELAILGPFLAHRFAPDHLMAATAISLALLATISVSVWCWKRGRDVASLGMIASGFVAAMIIAYIAVIPGLNPQRSHRDLALALDQLLPDDETTVMFFHELDEGLWFYMRDRRLAPVPNSQPQYNDAYDLHAKEQRLGRDLTKEERQEIERQRIRDAKQLLLDWFAAKDGERPSRHVLIRTKDLDFFLLDKEFKRRFDEAAIEVYRETDLKRSAVALARVRSDAVAAVPKAKTH